MSWTLIDYVTNSFENKVILILKVRIFICSKIVSLTLIPRLELNNVTKHDCAANLFNEIFNKTRLLR